MSKRNGVVQTPPVVGVLRRLARSRDPLVREFAAELLEHGEQSAPPADPPHLEPTPVVKTAG